MQGSIGGLGAHGIAVYKDVATNHHLKLGSPVPVVFRDTGPKTLRVALIYGDNQAAPRPAGSKKLLPGHPRLRRQLRRPHYDSRCS